MEIMGLAIIVILIVLGIMFALVWMAKTPQKQEIKARESILAANYLNTLIGTSVPDCGFKTMKKLLEDCALTGGIMTCDDGKNSCAKAQEVVSTLFEQTLQKWGKQYYFTVSGSPDAGKISSGKPCPGEKEAKEHPIPVRPGFDITLKLEICG